MPAPTWIRCGSRIKQRYYLLLVRVGVLKTRHVKQQVTSVLLHCMTAHPTEAQYSCGNGNGNGNGIGIGVEEGSDDVTQSEDREEMGGCEFDYY